MRHLHRLSWLMLAAGVVVTTAAIAFSLSPVVTLTGLMLAWAGIVKVIVVLLWTNVAGLGTDRHDPIPPV